MKRKTLGLVLIIASFVVPVAGAFAMQTAYVVVEELTGLQATPESDETLDELVETLALLSYLGLSVIGGLIYADAKGYSPWLGLVAVLCLVGLIVLIALPDKSVRTATSLPPPAVGPDGS